MRTMRSEFKRKNSNRMENLEILEAGRRRKMDKRKRKFCIQY